jgi:hypothetical protein
MSSPEPLLAPRPSPPRERPGRRPATGHPSEAGARGAASSGGLGLREEGARPAGSVGPSGEPSTHDAEGQGERRRRFHCRACDAHVADHADLFAAAGADAPGFFVNPAGRFFEVLTLRRARSIAVAGDPTLEATWFEGYAWQYALCARCTAHLGWRYVATAGADPPTFYGLIRDALVERDGHAPLISSRSCHDRGQKGGGVKQPCHGRDGRTLGFYYFE